MVNRLLTDELGGEGGNTLTLYAQVYLGPSKNYIFGGQETSYVRPNVQEPLVYREEWIDW